jgi:hypothetical protein
MPCHSLNQATWMEELYINFQFMGGWVGGCACMCARVCMCVRVCMSNYHGFLAVGVSCAPCLLKNSNIAFIKFFMCCITFLLAWWIKTASVIYEFVSSAFPMAKLLCQLWNWAICDSSKQQRSSSRMLCCSKSFLLHMNRYDLYGSTEVEHLNVALTISCLHILPLSSNGRVHWPLDINAISSVPFHPVAALEQFYGHHSHS